MGEIAVGFGGEFKKTFKRKMFGLLIGVALEYVNGFLKIAEPGTFIGLGKFFAGCTTLEDLGKSIGGFLKKDKK